MIDSGGYQKVKVVHALYGDFIGGGQIHVLGLARHQINLNWDVCVLVSSEGEFARQLKENSIRYKVVSMPKIFKFNTIKDWKSAIKSESPDMLHLHGARAGLWGRLAAPYSGSVTIIHTVHGVHFHKNKNLIVLALAWFAELFLKNKAKRTLCISNADIHDLKKLGILNEKNVRRISNGISLKISAKSMTRTEFGFHDNDFLIGALGRLDPVKGHRYAIEAVAKLRLNHPSLKLIIFGEGADRKPLENLTKKLNLASVVMLAGHVKDPNSALKILDLFVHPSILEGQGIAIMEAMQASLPIVASNVGGIPEVVSHEKEALLVEPKNSKALAEAIERLILNQELREKLGRQAKIKVREFDEVKAFNKTLEVYDEVLRGSN